jgi:hypothetical protein
MKAQSPAICDACLVLERLVSSRDVPLYTGPHRSSHTRPDQRLRCRHHSISQPQIRKHTSSTHRSVCLDSELSTLASIPMKPKSAVASSVSKSQTDVQRCQQSNQSSLRPYTCFDWRFLGVELALMGLMGRSVRLDW